MFRNASVVSTVVLFLGAGAAPAGSGMLDLIPQDAAAGVAFRNLDDFKKKADKFAADFQQNIPIGPSQIMALMYQQLGIQNGLDEDSTAAVILANPKAAGVKKVFGQDANQLLVLAVPFTDRDTMAGNFGFKQGDLKPEKMGKGKGPMFGKFFYARGKHLYMGDNEKAVTSVAKGKALAADLPEARRKALADADLLIHVGPPAWADEWNKALKDLESGFPKNGEKEEQELVRLFIKGLGHVRHGFAAVRFDGGLGVSLLATFPKEGNDAAQKFLKLVAAGGAPSRLTGLPQGNVLAALAAGGDGTKNALFAKVFFNFLLRNAAEAKKVIAPADRPGFVGIFTEVWQRLKGSRLAVYQNEAERAHGIFSVLAVLDTDDPDKFIADMRDLAHIADGKAVDLKTNTAREVDAAQIEALIRDLADQRFRVRQTATTKLRLLGEPALPYLNKAIKSDDVEVVSRAKRLKLEIEQAAAQRRKELFVKDLPRVVKPTFAFVRKAETRVGCRVHVVTVKLTGKDADAAPQFKQLFGPDWDKIRLAVHGKQVVALIGSDVQLLDDTLTNLKGKKPGLAGSKALAAFDRQRNPGRMFEAHVSVQGLLTLVTGPRANQPALGKPGEALTSGALTLEKDHVQFDLRLSSADIRTMIRQSMPR
jgi:hypothetical protein